MTTSSLAIEPKKLAQWLSITAAQRKRAKQQAIHNYGIDSAAALEIGAEEAEINIQIGYLLKEAAKGPYKGK